MKKLKKSPSIESLLRKADKAFGIDIQPGSFTFIYHLGRIGGEWRFTVTDDWYKWYDRQYAYYFVGSTPQGAIKDFLRYIKVMDINPYELRRH